MEALFSTVASGFSQMFAAGASGGLASTAMTVLQGGSTALSALSSLRGGDRSADGARESAEQSYLAADFALSDARFAAGDLERQGQQEFLVARHRGAQIRMAAEEAAGQQQVAFAASGVVSSDGTAARLQAQRLRRAEEDARMELASGRVAKASAGVKASNVRRRGRFEAEAHKSRGDQYLAAAESARDTARTDAIGRVFEFGMDYLKRG
ncbi:MAG: hypothetical protein ACRCS9_13955 [Hyphomicrobium sp.]